MRPARLHVVRDIERTLVLALSAAFAFALMLGAVAPAASEPEAGAVPPQKCERDEPGMALPVEPPAAGPSCPSDREDTPASRMNKR
ncbi:MAG: hypothetical protein ACXW2G_07245 [Burkholderiaceae bacterium]